MASNEAPSDSVVTKKRRRPKKPKNPEVKPFMTHWKLATTSGADASGSSSPGFIPQVKPIYNLNLQHSHDKLTPSAKAHVVNDSSMPGHTSTNPEVIEDDAASTIPNNSQFINHANEHAVAPYTKPPQVILRQESTVKERSTVSLLNQEEALKQQHHAQPSQQQQCQPLIDNDTNGTGVGFKSHVFRPVSRKRPYVIESDDHSNRTANGKNRHDDVHPQLPSMSQIVWQQQAEMPPGTLIPYEDQLQQQQQQQQMAREFHNLQQGKTSSPLVQIYNNPHHAQYESSATQSSHQPPTTLQSQQSLNNNYHQYADDNHNNNNYPSPPVVPPLRDEAPNNSSLMYNNNAEDYYNDGNFIDNNNHQYNYDGNPQFSQQQQQQQYEEHNLQAPDGHPQQLQSINQQQDLIAAAQALSHRKGPSSTITVDEHRLYPWMSTSLQKRSKKKP